MKHLLNLYINIKFYETKLDNCEMSHNLYNLATGNKK